MAGIVFGGKIFYSQLVGILMMDSIIPRIRLRNSKLR